MGQIEERNQALRLRALSTGVAGSSTGVGDTGFVATYSAESVSLWATVKSG